MHAVIYTYPPERNLNKVVDVQSKWRRLSPIESKHGIETMEKNAARIIELYLDFYNNYLTVEKFAEHYGMSVDDADKLLSVGRYIGRFDEGELRTYSADK